MPLQARTLGTLTYLDGVYRSSVLYPFTGM